MITTKHLRQWSAPPVIAGGERGTGMDSFTIIYGVFFVPPAAFAALSPFSWW
ncbi:hypothetical protein [Saccharopolyspora elongata]|uniref:hypothetical protein n=1 Tax=Saccharopolyspora elongata TaxID=2530387 RepID=UPI0014045A9E|nr:hypothetical protein [Saccharopolyspora elongata]